MGKIADMSAETDRKIVGEELLVTEFIQVELQESTAIIHLRRPPMNALNLQMQREIEAAATFVFTVCAVCNYVGCAHAFVTRLFDFSFQKLRFGARATLRCTIVSSRLLAMVVHFYFNGQGLVSGKAYAPHTRPLSLPRAHFLFPREAALAVPSSRMPWRAVLETSVVERFLFLWSLHDSR